MTLEPLPPAPSGVKYALTVPQSVLFADISLRGTKRRAFEHVFGTSFAMDYVVIDDGAMSWDYRGDAEFAKSLCGTAEPAVAVRRFISFMGATARAVERTSWILSSPRDRPSGHVDALLKDLREYWDAYERHMTSLFTFWNVEEFLSDALGRALLDARVDSDEYAGLERFLQPSEPNYFALERRHLARLATRFGANTGVSEAECDAALEHHARAFGFLLAPFNLGAPPSVATIRERLDDASVGNGEEVQLVDVRSDMLHDVPEPARELGFLAQELTFWKTERLDVMALGDAHIAPLYREAADTLDVSTDQLFAMTRHEIEASLANGAPVVPEVERSRRIDGYCLLLHGDKIGFYKPTQGATTSGAHDLELTADEGIRGTPTSPGVATGRVRLLDRASDIASLQSGDVLVTTMTRPEMGAALDRAVAFVTDEGGRMCHAAIISREMKKPCVTGTGTATRLLLDGMTVVVDGTEGTVTIVDAP
jgi:phosphohistidine swiveling domain-containing protein